MGPPRTMETLFGLGTKRWSNSITNDQHQRKMTQNDRIWHHYLKVPLVLTISWCKIPRFVPSGVFLSEVCVNQISLLFFLKNTIVFLNRNFFSLSSHTHCVFLDLSMLNYVCFLGLELSTSRRWHTTMNRFKTH